MYKIVKAEALEGYLEYGGGRHVSDLWIDGAEHGIAVHHDLHGGERDQAGSELPNSLSGCALPLRYAPSVSMAGARFSTAAATLAAAGRIARCANTAAVCTRRAKFLRQLAA